MWLADLLAHGLIRASFVPPVAVQELRTLTRTRKQFVRESRCCLDTSLPAFGR